MTDSNYDDIEDKIKREEKEKLLKKDQKISGRSVFELKKIIEEKGKEEESEDNEKEN